MFEIEEVARAARAIGAKSVRLGINTGITLALLRAGGGLRTNVYQGNPKHCSGRLAVPFAIDSVELRVHGVLIECQADAREPTPDELASAGIVRAVAEASAP